jgi:hypothetical protein
LEAEVGPRRGAGAGVRPCRSPRTQGRGNRGGDTGEGTGMAGMAGMRHAGQPAPGGAAPTILPTRMSQAETWGSAAGASGAGASARTGRVWGGMAAGGGGGRSGGRGWSPLPWPPAASGPAGGQADGGDLGREDGRPGGQRHDRKGEEGCEGSITQDSAMGGALGSPRMGGVGVTSASLS